MTQKRFFKWQRKAAQELDGGLVVGYNALHRGSWQSDRELKAHFLPIGEGLLVTRTGKKNGGGNRSHWVVKVDKYCSGEEHVFRIKDPRRKCIDA